MPRYAQIVNGTVILTLETGLSLDSFDPSLLMVDVTDMEPQPEPGWLYQPDKTPVFVPPEPEESPVIPEPEPALKTRYTHREFILRLGSHHATIHRLRDENNALPPSQKDYELERFFQLWEKSQDINLNDQDLHAAFDVFVGLDLMTRAEADIILTPNEDM